LKAAPRDDRGRLSRVATRDRNDAARGEQSMDASALKLAAAVAVVACVLAVGGCKKPVSTAHDSGSGSPASAGPAPQRTPPPPPPASPADPGASVFCDCAHVDAGLLTKEWRRQCADRDAQLRQMAADCGNHLDCWRSRFKLKQGPDGKLISGEFCDPSAHGPAAWPVSGGPSAPPPNPSGMGKPCTSTTGLVRKCD
jgi:hypothetical protein